MAISSLLSNIPIIRNFVGNNASQNAGTPASAQNASLNNAGLNNPDLNNVGDENTIRQRAIDDSVDISPAASRSLAGLDSGSDLSEDDVSRLLSQTQGVLLSNDNLALTDLSDQSQRIVQGF